MEPAHNLNTQELCNLPCKELIYYALSKALRLPNQTACCMCALGLASYGCALFARKIAPLTFYKHTET
jgi:hypothetical protein